MLQRLIITYLILTVGFTGISMGMIANGTASPWNPAWPFVTTVRNIFLGFGFIVAVGCGLIWILVESAEKEWSQPTMPGGEKALWKAGTSSPEAARLAEVEREQARLALEEKKRKHAEQEALEQEETKRRQDELKRQAEEMRKKRTAEDAAKTGLDDFL